MVREAQPHLIDHHLDDETKEQLKADYLAGRMSTRMMIMKYQRQIPGVKRQDLWVWLTRELSNGAS